jgi:ERCC4-type nuclease
MIIKIDSREHDLLQQITCLVENIPIFKSTKIVSETLPIGDIIISDGNEDKLIIERKSVSDLLASIKDGRYEEQSYRLNGLNHHNHNIIYLIEGDVNRVNRFRPDNRVEKLTLYSAMFSLNYYKGFSVFRTFSLEESATIICNMAYKLEKSSSSSGKNAFYSLTSPTSSQPKIQKVITESYEQSVVQENTNFLDDSHMSTELVPNTNDKGPTDKGSNDKVTTDKEPNDKVTTDKVTTDKVTTDKVTTDKVTTDKEPNDKGPTDKGSNDKEHTENEPSDKDYVGVVKKVKKENITCDNIAEIMLCQIPGISSVSALAIMDKYKTLPNLLKELEQNNECLKNVSYTNSKGQTRKINKTCAVNIVKYLLKK